MKREKKKGKEKKKGRGIGKSLDLTGPGAMNLDIYILHGDDETRLMHW